MVELSSAMFSLKFVRYCMAMWLPLYLLEALGYDKLQARYISSILEIFRVLKYFHRWFLCTERSY